MAFATVADWLCFQQRMWDIINISFHLTTVSWQRGNVSTDGKDICVLEFSLEEKTLSSFFSGLRGLPSCGGESWPSRRLMPSRASISSQTLHTLWKQNANAALITSSETAAWLCCYVNSFNLKMAQQLYLWLNRCRRFDRLNLGAPGSFYNVCLLSVPPWFGAWQRRHLRKSAKAAYRVFAFGTFIFFLHTSPFATYMLLCHQQAHCPSVHCTPVQSSSYCKTPILV